MYIALHPKEGICGGYGSVSLPRASDSLHSLWSGKEVMVEQSKVDSTGLLAYINGTNIAI